MIFLDVEIIENEFSICKLSDFKDLNFNDEFTFFSKTDNEISLVCKSDNVPKNCIECEHGFGCFRIKGILDFSIVGLIAKISTILAENKIVIFVVSTFNTDYIFVKKENLKKSIDLIKKIPS